MYADMQFFATSYIERNSNSLTSTSQNWYDVFEVPKNPYIGQIVGYSFAGLCGCLCLCGAGVLAVLHANKAAVAPVAAQPAPAMLTAIPGQPNGVAAQRAALVSTVGAPAVGALATAPPMGLTKAPPLPSPPALPSPPSSFNAVRSASLMVQNDAAAGGAGAAGAASKMPAKTESEIVGETVAAAALADFRLQEADTYAEKKAKDQLAERLAKKNETAAVPEATAV